MSTALRIVHHVGAGDELVELDEKGGIGDVFDHRHYAAGVAVPVFAFEGEGGGGEHHRRNAAFGEVLDDFKRRAAAGAAAQRGHDDRQTDAFDVLVETFYRVFGGEPPGDDVTAGPASREAVSADENEGVAAAAGGRVGVGEDVSQAFAEGAAYASGHHRAGGADPDQKHGRRFAHLKNLPKRPSRIDFSS